MIKNWLWLFIMVGSLSGCTSMLPHYRFSDTEVVNQAEAMAMAATCVEKGLAPGNLVYAYGYAMGELYSMSVYDKDLYAQTFQKKKSELENYFPSSQSAQCGGIAVHFPRMTNNVIRQYSDIARSRQGALAGMSQSLASFGQNMPTYDQPPMAVLSGEVNFGLPESKTNHYLVDFDGGQRMCTLTSSGYVFCN